MRPEKGFGRPPELDDIVAQKIVKCLQGGNSRRCAAAAAGIHYATLKRWLARGRAGATGYAEFLRRVEEATAACEWLAVERVRAGGPGWQGMAWWLERHPTTRWRWRRPAESREASGSASAGAQSMTNEELLAIAKGLEDANRQAGTG